MPKGWAFLLVPAASLAAALAPGTEDDDALSLGGLLRQVVSASYCVRDQSASASGAIPSGAVALP
jgi:hypothetical protein